MKLYIIAGEASGDLHASDLIRELKNIQPAIEIRAWGFNPLNNRQNYIFDNLQSGSFAIKENKSFQFRLIRYGSYIELSIDNVVKLTLIDYTYTGNGIGLFSASSVLSLQQLVIKVLPDPEEEYASQEEEQKLFS